MRGRMHFKFTVDFDADKWDSGVPYELAAVIRKIIETGTWEKILRPNSVYPPVVGDKVVSFEHTPYIDEPDHFTESIF